MNGCSLNKRRKKAAADINGGSIAHKAKCCASLSFCFLAGDGLGDSAATDATGASLDTNNLTGFELMTNFLQVGHETAFGLDVGVRDVVAGLGTLSTYIANLGHGDLLVYSKRIVYYFKIFAGWGC